MLIAAPKQTRAHQPLARWAKDTSKASAAQEVVRSPGQPLDAAARAFMEPRLGHSLRDVRVHTDDKAADSARALGAQAYTVGNNVVFGARQYSPTTDSGRRLLAHELAHTVQQRGPVSQIRRKIAVQSEASLDDYFASQKITGIDRSGDEYSYHGATRPNVREQILADMLYSPRVFYVYGTNDLEAADNLESHVQAREGIVKFAAQKRYGFSVGAAFRMNPKYWNVNPADGDWAVKPGVDGVEAMRDLNVNPGEYSIACTAATLITMVGGSGGSPIVVEEGGGMDDWVPGEIGYVENTAYSGVPGREGENLIYVGLGKFWGHFSSANTYHTLSEWFNIVKSWDGAALTWTSRGRPARGLL